MTDTVKGLIKITLYKKKNQVQRNNTQRITLTGGIEELKRDNVNSKQMF